MKKQSTTVRERIHSRPHPLRSQAVLLTAGGALAAMLVQAQAASIEVTSNADTGAGSLRAAIEQANTDPSIDEVVVSPNINEIDLHSTISFTGPQTLLVNGNGVAIQSGSLAAFDLLSFSGHGSISLEQITVRNSLARGIVVSLPATATDPVTVTLSHVSILDNSLHGFHLEDASASSAGVRLIAENILVQGNGFGATDQDGVRVDETGPGELSVSIQSSFFHANGGDGVELDESGAGDVVVELTRTSFDDNGFQDPDDVEDGIDVDEADAGDTLVHVTNCSAEGNGDEGLDFNESGDGSIAAEIRNVRVRNNGDPGIDMDEVGDGGIWFLIENAVVQGSTGDDGIDIQEEEAEAGDPAPGDINGVIANSVISQNADFGVRITERGLGAGTITLENVVLIDNDDGAYRITGAAVDIVRGQIKP